MLTVDAPKFLVCFLTFFAISNVLYDLNNLLSAAFDGEVAEEEACAKCTEKDAGKTD